MRQPEINRFTVTVEAVNAHNKSYGKINAKVRRTACAYKWESDTDTRQKHKAHTDIDDCLSTDHKHNAVAEQGTGQIS